jgi:hypothetical protein
MWWIVVEIRHGKHDSTPWIGTQQMLKTDESFEK